MENKTLCRLIANTVSELRQEQPSIAESDSLLKVCTKEGIMIMRCGAIPLCGRVGRLRRCSGAATPGHCRILFSEHIITYKAPCVKFLVHVGFLLFEEAV